MDAGRWRDRIWRPLLIVVAGAAAYSNSFSGVFFLDDEPSLTQFFVRDPLLGWPHYLGATSGRPVTYATFAANYAADGLDPWGYHLVNLAVHLVNALLLFALVVRTPGLSGTPDRLRASAENIAAAAALLWVVHPLTTQAVTYVVQRMESLMAMWYLAALLAVNRAATAHSPWGRSAWSVAAVLAGWLCIGSKETGMTVPVAALLYDRCYFAGSWVVALRRRGPVYFGMAAGWLHLVPLFMAAASTAVIDVPAGPGGGPPAVTGRDYMWSQPGVILRYLRLAVWPDPLCFDPRWPVARAPGEYVPQVIVVAGLIGATLGALWRRPRLGFLPAAVFLVLSPSSSVVAIRDLMFEYRMYLPLTAVAVLAVLAADSVVPRRLSPWVLAVVVILFGARTYQRNELYRDPVTMWADVARQRPGSPRSLYWLGKSLVAAGRPAEAVERFRAVIGFDNAADPENAVDDQHRAEAHDGLGLAFAGVGDDAAAAAEFRTALELNPVRLIYARHLAEAEKRLKRN